MQVKKRQLELDRSTHSLEQETGSKLGEEYVKAIYCHPAYLTYRQNARLDEAQAGIKIARRNINSLRYADDTTLMAESEEDVLDESILTKEHLDESKRGE